MEIFQQFRRYGVQVLPLIALLGPMAAQAEAESFVSPTSGTLYVKCAAGNAGAVSQFGIGTSPVNFVPYLNSLPGSCPTSEVSIGAVSAGETVPFGIHTLWQGQDYWAFSTGTDEASNVAFSDIYNRLRMDGKIIQQNGPNLWVMHLNDAAHYTVDYGMANNFLIQIRLVSDESASVPASAVTTALITGRWSATVADSKATSHVDIDLTQDSDGHVAGEYSSSQGGNGTVKGAVAGADFSFELTQTVEGCPGIFKGNGVLEGNRIVGSYTGSDCLGDRGIGSFTMARSTFSQLSRPTVVVNPPIPPQLPAGNFMVKAVGYRVIPHERSSYFAIAGHSNTSCYGSGTYFGNSASGTVNCSTVTTPPQYRSLTIRSIEIYDQVEADGMIYTIRCTANWVGSNCSWLTPGDVFSAEIKGREMWITARKGGNLGKQIHAKYQMLDRRPKT